MQRVSLAPALELVAGIALLVAATPTAGQEACTVHPSGGVLGLGEAVLLDFGPDSTVTSVFVRVQDGMLRPWVLDALVLDITITSVDGIAHLHGTDLLPLTEATAVAQSEELVTLEIAWTEDDEPQVPNDLYTVCVQLVAGSPVAPERCQDFGPFF